jgi:predicted DCC family thiol-disulfide oxidoreductase YuxK
MSDKSDTRRIVLFDGLCNLCNGSVKFIIKRDPAAQFHFASLQSDTGRKVVEEHGGNPDDLDTILLLEGDRRYSRSSAALRIAKRLRAPWPLLSLFLVVPAPIRDLVYRFIARNRYCWFGKTDACMVPTAAIRARFLSE